MGPVLVTVNRFGLPFFPRGKTLAFASPVWRQQTRPFFLHFMKEYSSCSDHEPRNICLIEYKHLPRSSCCGCKSVFISNGSLKIAPQLLRKKKKWGGGILSRISSRFSVCFVIRRHENESVCSIKGPIL